MISDQDGALSKKFFSFSKQKEFKLNKARRASGSAGPDRDLGVTVTVRRVLRLLLVLVPLGTLQKSAFTSIAEV